MKMSSRMGVVAVLLSIGAALSAADTVSDVYDRLARDHVREIDRLAKDAFDAVVERDAAVSRLEACQVAVRSLEASLATAKTSITRLSSDVSGKDAEIAGRIDAYGKLNRELGAAQARIADLEKAVTTGDATAIGLRDRIAAMAAEIDAIATGLTAPATSPLLGDPVPPKPIAPAPQPEPAATTPAPAIVPTGPVVTEPAPVEPATPPVVEPAKP